MSAIRAVRHRSVDIGLHAALQKAAGEDEALDLARPLPDPVDADLAPEARDRVLGHVATAAEDLEGAVDDAPGRLGGEELRRSHLPVDDLAVLVGVERVSRVVGEESCRQELGQRVCELEGDTLVLGDRLPEGDTLQRPVAGDAERALRGAAAARRDEQALDEEPLLRTLVAARRYAVLVRNTAIAEDDLRMVVQVGIVQEARDARELEAGCAGLD